MAKKKKDDGFPPAERVQFLRDLFKEFGAQLAGMDPGVTGVVLGMKGRGSGWGGEHLSFDAKEWSWLEPLLIELRNRRYKRDLDGGSRATGRVVEKATTGSRKPSGNEAGRKPPRSPDGVSLERLLESIRSYGYAVGIHNDYRLNGQKFTYWQFTHPDGTYLKGEGPTDKEALNEVMEKIYQEQER